jgi:hypothetical protein
MWFKPKPRQLLGFILPDGTFVPINWEPPKPPPENIKPELTPPVVEEVIDTRPVTERVWEALDASRHKADNPRRHS